MLKKKEVIYKNYRFVRIILGNHAGNRLCKDCYYYNDNHGIESCCNLRSEYSIVSFCNKLTPNYYSGRYIYIIGKNKE